MRQGTIVSAITNPNKEKWITDFARFGFVAKGIVYCLIGILSVMAAVGLGSKKADNTEALKLIYDQPFGKVLLVLIALGLFGYVTWRLFQAFKDTEHKGKKAKGILKRISYGIRALIYAGLGIYAVKLVLNGPSSGGDNSKQFLVSKILEYPWGAWLIGIIALIMIGNGIWQIYFGVTGKFMKTVSLVSSSNSLYKRAGTIGYIARGIMLGIVGYFFLSVALNHNAKEVQGTGSAFDFLQNNFGSVLMGVVALGLIAYGIFMFVRAKYERIHIS